MTLIVGVEDKDGAWVGADSAMGNANHRGSRTADQPKVWRRGPYIIGLTGSARALDVIHYTRIPLPPTNVVEGVAMHRFLVTKVVPVWRQALREAGLFGQHEGKEVQDSDFLIAVGPHVYELDSWMSVTRERPGYIAIGSGASVALGALHATIDAESPERRVRIALRAAHAHTAFVRPPFRILGPRA